MAEEKMKTTQKPKLAGTWTGESLSLPSAARWLAAFLPVCRAVTGWRWPLGVTACCMQLVGPSNAVLAVTWGVWGRIHVMEAQEV